ncbi:hypothetical protein NA78x_000128 [Anatilimnocola sp. NA78]|uniref:hypothetical protein n=1 Tax=Anatilimnocola sp. NA78 TaxID=3415683 RepID=UPI003CE5C21C
MSVAFCVIFQKKVAPYGTLGSDNPALTSSYERLDKLAAAQGVATLGSFLSQDPAELADMLGLDPDDLDAAPEEWFEAAAGLQAVEEITAFVQANPKAIRKADEILEELASVKLELAAAVKKKVKFHFAIVP